MPVIPQKILKTLLNTRGEEMRDANRLYQSYEQLREIHKKLFPDMREGQFLMNLIGWIVKNKRDPFFMESKEFLTCAREYGDTCSPYHKLTPKKVGGDHHV